MLGDDALVPRLLCSSTPRDLVIVRILVSRLPILHRRQSCVGEFHPGETIESDNMVSFSFCGDCSYNLLNLVPGCVLFSLPTDSQIHILAERYGWQPDDERRFSS